MNEPRVDWIREYGLSEYEARAYLALLDLHGATARDLASVSRVPRTKIYSVLEDLHEKRLAQIIPEKPKRYEAVPFDAYLHSFESQYREKLDRIQEDRRRLVAPFGGAFAGEPVRRVGGFHVVKGRKNVLQKKEEMLGAAAREVLEVGSEWAAARLAQHLPTLSKVRERGADVRLLYPVARVAPMWREALESLAEMRAPPDPSPASCILIVDGRELLIAHHVPDDEHLYRGEDVAIWSDDGAFVHDVRETVLAQWKHGGSGNGHMPGRNGSVAGTASGEEGPDPGAGGAA